MEVLDIQDLSKFYGSFRALNNINFKVNKGEICGLLGPNGAGKTTLLRIINAILVKDKGKVLINGEESSLKTGRKIGYMPEERGLYDKMRVEDQILYFGRLKGGEPKRLRKVMNEYMEIFNLAGQEKRKVKELSKGNQQKVQIIATLVHEPELVILDEPFSGFDPINGALLKDLIARLHETGATIMLSSHNMPAIEEMCDTIALINNGELLCKGDISDIKEQYKTGELIMATRKPLDLSLLEASGVTKYIKETVTTKNRKGYFYKLRKNEGIKNADLLNEIALQGEVIFFEEALPSLNEIFLRLTSAAN